MREDICKRCNAYCARICILKNMVAINVKKCEKCKEVETEIEELTEEETNAFKS